MCRVKVCKGCLRVVSVETEVCPGCDGEDFDEAQMSPTWDAIEPYLRNEDVYG